MKDMYKKCLLILILSGMLISSCKKNIVEQYGGPLPVKAYSFLTYTGYTSPGSLASDIYQIGIQDSNLGVITTNTNIASRYNHNSTFTGYNTLVFSSDSLYDSVSVTALYQYNETTHTLNKLTQGLYRDQNPSYSNYNNILAFTRDTTWVDTVPSTHPFRYANVLYLTYLSKGITVPITNFRYGKIGHSTFSKNGSTIYFDYKDSTNISHIYSLSIKATGLTQLTNSLFGEEYPSLSPDGKTLAIATYMDANHISEEISLVNPDGTNTRQITHISKTAVANQPCWDPSGNRIYFTLYDPGKPGTPSHIYSTKPDGTGILQFSNGNGEAYPQAAYVSF